MKNIHNAFQEIAVSDSADILKLLYSPQPQSMIIVSEFIKVRVIEENVIT